MSIYSGDDYSLPSGNHADLTKDPRTQVDRLSPGFSESQGSAGGEHVEPRNLQSVIQSPSMTSDRVNLSRKLGFRAAEAWTRPSPIVTNGRISQYGFDLKNCTFKMSLTARSKTVQDAPTEIFLPDFHFPSARTEIEVTAGEWTIDYHRVSSAKLQCLQWWHPAGDHEIKIQGVKRKPGELTAETAEESGYVDQCQRGECALM